jgi:hypothetical protein
MDERVDHAIGQALDVDIEGSTFVELPHVRHNLRALLDRPGGSYGLIRQLKIARQLHGIGPTRRHRFGRRRTCFSADPFGRLYSAVRLFNLHGAHSVHSYMANRHHICNL